MYKNRQKSQTLKILPWKEVRTRVSALNPTLAEEINRISEVDTFSVIHVKYPFGAPIIRNGLLYLNFDGDLLNYKNPNIPNEIRELLDYNWASIPFGLVLHNTFESHIDIPTHTIPLRLLQPGDTFALLSIFEEKGSSHLVVAAQSATAGCRSLITLPSIAHVQYCERLTKKFHLPEVICPKELTDQWPLLQELSEAKLFRSNWECEVLFFSKNFITAMTEQSRLKESLLTRIWKFTTFERNYAMYELVFSIFAETFLPLSIRNSVSVIGTIKHILQVALQQKPAYIPCTNETAGPVSGFMKAIIEVYRIRYYWPVFMQLANYDGTKPVYYSLQKHTFLHTMPKNNNSNNKTILELKEIKEVLELFKEKVLKQQLPISLKGTALYKMLKDVEFDYFHPHTDESGIINDIGLLAEDDKRFSKLILKFEDEKELGFPVKSIFFYGCIRIRPKSKKSSRSKY